MVGKFGTARSQERGCADGHLFLPLFVYNDFEESRVVFPFFFSVLFLKSIVFKMSGRVVVAVIT